MPRAIFLGGLLSAILVAIGFRPSGEGVFERVLPWFALTPLIISLHRNRHRGRRRWLHGLTFGWILCACALHPLVQNDLSLAGGRDAGLRELCIVLGRNGLLWTALALTWGTFSWAGGLLLRSRMVTVPLLGLPVLWAGLEYFRASISPIPISWLLLGESLDPGSPESFASSTIGVLGLGALLVLTSTAFALLVSEARISRQVLLPALACMVVVACYFHGLRPEDETGTKTLRAGIVQIESVHTEETLELASRIVSSDPQLVVFPETMFLTSDARRNALEERLVDFARVARSEILTGIGSRSDDEAAAQANGDPAAHGRSSGLASEIVFVTREGGVRARIGSPEAGPEREGETPLGAAVLETEMGRLGVGFGDVFDGPDLARRLAIDGAQIFFALDRDGGQSGESFATMRARMHAFRALENGTSLARATLAGVSGVFDAHGRPSDRSRPGSSWANVGPVTLRSDSHPLTAYTRWGWKLGVVSLGLAAGFIVAAALEPLARRAPAGKTA